MFYYFFTKFNTFYEVFFSLFFYVVYNIFPYMFSNINKSFLRFCEERNLKRSTINGYKSTLVSYTNFNKMSIEELFEEALDDEENIHLIKNRRIKKRLIDYRNYLINEENKMEYTVKTYISRIKTFYHHFEIEVPDLPPVKYKKEYEVSYYDLPTREDIKKAIEIVPLPVKALILFMSSSGTARAETLSLTVEDFIKATSEYYTKENLDDILNELKMRDDINSNFISKENKDR